MCSFNSLASKEEEEPQSKISSSRAEYKRLKRELMESKTEKTEKEESSTGMNTCMSICKFSEDDWQFSPGSRVASASLGGQKKFIIKDKKKNNDILDDQT